MRKKLLLMILASVLLMAGCESTASLGQPEFSIPTLESIMPVKPVLIAQAETVQDLVQNYNLVVGYSLDLEKYIKDLTKYNSNILDILLDIKEP